jgi:hypothetical protein
MDRADNDRADILAARPNAQPGTDKFTSRIAHYKNLHPRRESKENNPDDAGANGRPPSSSSSSSGSRSPALRTSRIPKPSPAKKTLSKPRRPLSLSEAYKMAEEEEASAARGSPSPAPRPWRVKGDLDEGRMRKLLGDNASGFGHPRNSRRIHNKNPDEDNTQSSGASSESPSRRSQVSAAEIDRNVGRHEEDQSRIEGVVGGKNGLFSKTNVGPRVAETAQELQRKASNNSLGGRSPSPSPRQWGVRGKPRQHWLTRILSSPGRGDGREDDETERDAPVASLERASPAARLPDLARSPEKSFAWQTDADFTARELEVSSSPPVRNLGHHDSQPSRSKNERLDEIRQLEIEAALRFPDDSQGVQSEALGANAGFGPSQNRSDGRTNTKINEIRAREMDSVTRRAVATARLGEIRQRNAEYKSPSPDTSNATSPDGPGRRPSDRRETEQIQSLVKSILEEEGERIPDAPITTYSKSQSDKPAIMVGEGQIPVDADSARSRDNSRDLLRSLSRATNSSPLAESSSNGDRIKMTSSGGEKCDSRDDRMPAIDVKSSSGISALRRISSTDSNSTKRSSIAQSDGDPVDRIDSEMKLFAPMEAQSERGSIRAPSPRPDDDENDDAKDGDAEPDETPRPKVTTRTTATPRVTGAYFDTPLAVKTEPPVGEAPLPSVAVASFLRDRFPRSSRPADNKSDGGRKDTVRSSAVSIPQRSRSLPRARSPLFISKRPPTARDDLLEIQRQHQVEDSTLDDIGGIDLDEKIGAVTKPGDDEKEMARMPGEDELEAYERMSKALRTGLLGIQTAKKGIERLEDQVSHSELARRLDGAHLKPLQGCATCDGQSAASPPVAYLHLPVPRLYHRQPTLRLSFLGTLLLLLSLWLTAESSICYYYCRPQFCAEGQACVWSPDDPFFPYALPVKLDQWATGGYGRATVARLGASAGDMLADTWDIFTGNDISKVDIRHLTLEQRRRYRRRMFKKGLIGARQYSREEQAKLDAWQAARQARDRAREAREMGYDIGDGFDDERMGNDEPVSSTRGWF